MLTNYQLKIPHAVFAGDEPTSHLRDTVKGVRKAVVFTYASIVQAGLLAPVTNILEEQGVSYSVLEDLPLEPTVAQAEAVVRAFRAEKADFIIAIGGGSVMDIAKLASILDTDAYSIRDLLTDPALGKKTTRTLMIPTTAGTGAEATPNAIVTVPEKALKVGVVNSDMIADEVILDAEMIRGLPRPIAASTGIDALAHAIECYTSNKANPFSDMFALEAFRLIEQNLEPACDGDMGAKQRMLLASFYAGVAISAAGTTGVHALSYPLGGRYHIAHGISNAIMLMPVMRFNEPAVRPLFARAYDCVRPAGGEATEADKSSWILSRMEQIVHNVGIPSSLVPYGVSKDDLEDLVTAGMEVKRLLNNNMRKITAEDARALYREVL